MPHGWKDYTMPITIEAVTVETLPVDIKAQTVATLKIDIAAQTLSRLNVNIAASSITLDVNISASAVTLNVKTAVGEHVDTDIVSSITLKTDIVAQTVGNIGIDIKAQTLPQLNVNIAASAVTLNVNIASSSTTLNVNLAASAITLDVNIAASAVTLNVKTAVGEHVDTDIVSSITLKTDITAQSVGNIGVDIKAQSLSQLNVNIAASAITLDVNIASSAVTLNVNIASSAATLNVNIASSATTLNVNLASSAVTLDVNIASSSTTLNVNIASSSATLNVCIASQTVDINVKTSGGANIVIDKLTQSAYTARGDTLAWNGPSPSWYAPTGNYRYGKLFPRGARGFIRNIGVYCRDAGTAGGTVYVFISPAPYLGPVYSGTITVPAAGAADWRNWAIEKMWNYDSLFIWAYTSSGYIQLAYDVGGPDCFYSSDGGLTWTGTPSTRFWFRAEVQGMTVGDIPVSGTINTVEIPNVFSEFGKFTSPLVDGGTSSDILPTIYGSGVLTCFICLFTKYSGNVNPNYQVLGIEVDGKTKEISMYSLAHPSGFVTNAFQPVSFSQYDDTNQRYAFGFNFPIKFKRSLRIYAKNTAAAGNILQAFALIGYELLT